MVGSRDLGATSPPDTELLLEKIDAVVFHPELRQPYDFGAYRPSAIRVAVRHILRQLLEVHSPKKLVVAPIVPQAVEPGERHVLV